MTRSKVKSDDFNYLLQHKRLNIYMALEDLDLFWMPNELKKLIYWWYEGYSIFRIANELKRDIDEIAIVLIDIAETRRNLICKRNRGLLDSLPVKKTKDFNKKIHNFLKIYPNGYTVFQNYLSVDFFWDERKINIFQQLWDRGFSLEDISKQMKRNKIDCILLLIDQLRKGYISGRKGILEGWEKRKAG